VLNEQRDLGKGTTFEVGYNGSQSRHLDNLINAGAPIPGTANIITRLPKHLRKDCAWRNVWEFQFLKIVASEQTALAQHFDALAPFKSSGDWLWRLRKDQMQTA